MKKCMALIVSISMLLSTASSVLAYDEIAQADSVVYSYSDMNNQTVEVTAQELADDHWNAEKLDGDPPELYEDFPMSIESDMNNRAELTLSLFYLKNIGVNDSVSLTIKERGSETIFIQKDFTAGDDILFVEDIPIGKTYNLTLSENLGGDSEVYNCVVTTEYEQAYFPVDISLYSVTDADDVRLKITETRTEENAGEELEDYMIPAEDLPELYTTLSDDTLYVIQMSAPVDGQYELYKAFFSTEDSMQGYGIFVPTHRYYTEQAYLNMVSTISPASTNVDTDSHMGENTWTVEDLEEERTIIGWNRDVFINLPVGNTYYKVFKVPLEDISYFNIKTSGNSWVDCSLWYYDEETNKLEYDFIPTRDKNLNITRGTVPTDLYILVYIQGGGKTVLTFSFTNQDDDVTNSIYELSNPASGTPTYTPYNTLLQREIDYGRDVDVFYINRNDNYINAPYSVQLEHTGTAPTNVIAKLMVDAGEQNGWVWEDTDFDIHAMTNEGIHCDDFRMSDNYKYFIEISLATNKMTTGYNLKILRPDYPDQYEGTNGNNTQANAYTLPNDDGYFETVTLHYNDVDYFKFNTGAGGADVEFRIDRTETNLLYNLQLTGNGVTTQNGEYNNDSFRSNRIIAEDLPANTDIYLRVSSSGTKYSPGASYWLQYEITRNTPPLAYSAQLSSDVEIDIGEDDTVSDLSDIMDEIMSKLTCKYGETVISSSEAQADVALYYMNGSVKTPLTAAVVNSLEPGSYDIIAEYHDVQATGGDITLNITEAPVVEPGEQVMLDTITIQGTGGTYAWDWAACAYMAANSRLARENKPASTVGYASAISAIKPSDLFSRGNLGETVQAANYIYTNGQSQTSNNFINNTVSQSTAEDYFLAELKLGKSVILMMTSKTDPDDLSLARYVLLIGIDTGANEYTVVDPTLSTTVTISEDELFDGYNSNNDLEFTGAVIEFV